MRRSLRVALICPISALDPRVNETDRERKVDLISDVFDSNLVDSASSHTLVSKIKPCMSKYKRLYTVKLRTAH
jgi:hypothetical protein